MSNMSTDLWYISSSGSEEENKAMKEPLMPSLSPKNPSKAVVLMKSKELMKSKMDPRKPLTQRPHSYPSFKKSKTPVLNQLFQSRNLEFLDKERMKRQETKTKSFLYTIINPRSRQWPALCFKLLISNVIIFDFISFIISTEPKYRNNDFKFFDITEGITSSIFLLEYLVRLYTITENKKFGHLGKFWGRIRFVMTLGSIIDLTATLPFFIQHYSGLELPKLSYLRTFRLFRILKTPSFVKAIDAVYRVIYYNREIMYLSLFVGLFMILTTSVLMFYLRPRNEYKSDEFESILSTMYLSTLMLTGQGGPEGDLPWYTKGVVLMTSAFSIGMFAIPVSMLTWGFEAEAERCAKRTRALQKRDELRATGEYDGSSTEDYSTDEEYQKIIAGEDADADNEDDEVKEALKSFLLADADSSGSINLKEYIQISRSNKNKPVEGSMNGNTAALTDRLDRLEEKVDGIAEKLSMLCDKLATANL